MSTKLSEMFRRYYCDESGCIGHYVELLPSELVVALIVEGGTTIWWCEEHKNINTGFPNPVDGRYYCRGIYAEGGDCREREVLLVPIPVESAEDKET